jgi:hypothetical protein
LILALTGSAIGKARRTALILTHKVSLGAGAADDSSSALQAEADEIRAKFAHSILREVGVLTFGTLSPRAIALHAMQRLIGASGASGVVVEEVVPIHTASTSSVAGTSHASLQGGIARDAYSFPVRVVEVLDTGLTEGLVEAGLTMRDVGHTGEASRIVQIVIVRDASSADVLFRASVTPRTENPTRNTLSPIHKGIIIALAASLSSTALTVGELSRTLATAVVIGVVEIGLALGAVVVVGTETASGDDLRA